VSFERLLQTKWTYTKNCNLTIMVASWWWIQLQSDLPISMQHKSAPLLILSDALVGDISSAQFCWTWKDCKCKEHRLTLSAALNIEAIWRLHLMPNHCHEQFSVWGAWYLHLPKMWGQQGEAVSPVQSSLKPGYKGARFDTVCSSWVCTGAYDAAATHPYPTGASASLLSSLLSNQARVTWPTHVKWAASASGEFSGFQGGRLLILEERSSHNNKHHPTNLPHGLWHWFSNDTNLAWRTTGWIYLLNVDSGTLFWVDRPFVLNMHIVKIASF